MFKRITYILGITGFLAFLGCKSMEVPVMPEMEEVPDAFLDYQDSTSVADISWREFFNDPNLIYLIDYALENNLNLLSTIERVEIAKANYQMRKGLLFPTMDAIVRYRSGDIRPNLFNGTVN
jgi:outer membrane protein TolC